MKKSLLVAGVLLALATLPAAASTFVALTDAELVRGADAIVRGKVIHLESSWNENGTVIVTDAVVKVRETLRGEAPQLVTVRTFGGRVGDFGVEAIGFPRFGEREQVILFLQRPSAGPARVLGFQQGHWQVVERLDGVKLAVPRVEDGAALVTRDGSLRPEPKSVRLRDFKRYIRRIERHDRGTLSR